MQRLVGWWILCLLSTVLSGCADSAVSTTSSSSAEPVASEATAPTTGDAGGPGRTSAPTAATLPGLDGLGFDDFIEESYEVLLLRDPQFLTSLGITERLGLRNDRLNDMSPRFVEETHELERAILDQLHSYDRGVLDHEDRLSHDVYEWYLETLVAGHEFTYHQWPVHHYVNGYNYNLLIFLQEEHAVNDVDDAEDYISRLTQIERQVDQVIESLRSSVDGGIVAPRLVLDRTVERLRDDLGGTADAEAVVVESLPLHSSFAERLDAASIVGTERDELLDRAGSAIKESFVPGWIQLHDYIASLRALSGEEPGAGRLPNGESFYAWLLRWHTSTDLSAGEIHEQGLENVARIQEDMRRVFDRLGYPVDQPIPALVDRATRAAGFLRGEEPILRTNENLIAEAERAARPHFGLWPEALVEVVPDAGGGGFYVPGSADGSRPGKFHAGTSGEVPLIITPTVNYHEAVPGHHTQIAISQELDLPSFRRFIRYNAYTEGWALYAESLAGELGLYDENPLGEIGRLQLELLRAVRLVVDTGIHAMGWTRERASAYMNEVIPAWSFEVERYIVLPGQATGYMIGMQEILRLREAAMTSSGAGFSLSEFHDAVLGFGSLPLTILGDVMTDAAGADG
jgi:uncharacterized protein (DUF885 family)